MESRGMKLPSFFEVDGLAEAAIESLLQLFLSLENLRLLTTQRFDVLVQLCNLFFLGCTMGSNTV